MKEEWNIQKNLTYYITPIHNPTHTTLSPLILQSHNRHNKITKTVPLPHSLSQTYTIYPPQNSKFQKNETFKKRNCQLRRFFVRRTSSHTPKKKPTYFKQKHSYKQSKSKRCQESRQRRRAVVPLLEVSHYFFFNDSKMVWVKKKVWARR